MLFTEWAKQEANKTNCERKLCTFCSVFVSWPKRQWGGALTRKMQFCAGASGSQKDVAADLALFSPFQFSVWLGESIPLLVIKLHFSSAFIRWFHFAWTTFALPFNCTFQSCLRFRTSHFASSPPALAIAAVKCVLRQEYP